MEFCILHEINTLNFFKKITWSIPVLYALDFVCICLFIEARCFMCENFKRVVRGYNK